MVAKFDGAVALPRHRVNLEISVVVQGACHIFGGVAVAEIEALKAAAVAILIVAAAGRHKAVNQWFKILVVVEHIAIGAVVDALVALGADVDVKAASAVCGSLSICKGLAYSLERFKAAVAV